MKRIEAAQIELQIAPLIDVCFLLLFFFHGNSGSEQEGGEG
jgi:hypothetical protein